MIKIDLHLPDGRKIPVKVRDRHYKKLTAKVEQLNFIDKLRLLFKWEYRK